MYSNRRRSHARQAALSATVGLLLAGAAAVPAHADSVRHQQWFLDAMKAEQMWQTSTGKGITVAVIDTGVNADHPDLKGRVLPGKDMATDKPGDEHTDYEGHGTGMAGLIAGTGARAGGNGAYGLAPGARILPIRLPREDGLSQAEGNKDLAEKSLPAAIRYAADAGAKVINISQASTANSAELTAAVRYALDKGSLIFAAVGNEAEQGNPVEYPAATPGVVGVAAVGKDLKRTAESEYGSQVDVAAPGEDMVAACGAKTGLCRDHGTSGATALASASAALIWSTHPKWTNNQILKVMLNTIGAPVDGSERTDAIGHGIVRPRIALTNPGNPGPADTYPLPDFPVKATTPPSSPAPVAGHGRDGATVAKEDNGSTVLGVVAGVGAVVLLSAVAALAVMRRRRRTGAASHRSAPPGQISQPGQSYATPPQGGLTGPHGQDRADSRRSF
ncbi:type VII secretion-associated serine protease mycosin [Streptomyces sp. NPDC058686]|uniref:type VII secretion-associated serine protease mycosin n=1 Tax=Streptomyces sp. NPDC058686 TaxID=3346599 RepID=UPI003665CB09